MRRSAVFQPDIDPDVQQINALNQLQPSAKSAQSFTNSLHALLLFVFKSATRLRKQPTHKQARETHTKSKGAKRATPLFTSIVAQR